MKEISIKIDEGDAHVLIKDIGTLEIPLIIDITDGKIPKHLVEYACIGYCISKFGCSDVIYMLSKDCFDLVENKNAFKIKKDSGVEDKYIKTVNQLISESKIKIDQIDNFKYACIDYNKKQEYQEPQLNKDIITYINDIDVIYTEMIKIIESINDTKSFLEKKQIANKARNRHNKIEDILKEIQKRLK